MSFPSPTFVSVDWGTSAFRVWLAAADGSALGIAFAPAPENCATLGQIALLERMDAV